MSISFRGYITDFDMAIPYDMQSVQQSVNQQDSRVRLERMRHLYDRQSQPSDSLPPVGPFKAERTNVTNARRSHITDWPPLFQRWNGLPVDAAGSKLAFFTLDDHVLAFEGHVKHSWKNKDVALSIAYLLESCRDLFNSRPERTVSSFSSRLQQLPFTKFRTKTTCVKHGIYNSQQWSHVVSYRSVICGTFDTSVQ
ncbi:hypothetical protein F5I97DRAFT_36474 [Phlebopus sp. FC_14]|nr:hypothetical protein F5I97DRAFT_36474 [Phlebopus sp. FC_14]